MKSINYMGIFVRKVFRVGYLGCGCCDCFFSSIIIMIVIMIISFENGMMA